MFILGYRSAQPMLIKQIIDIASEQSYNFNYSSKVWIYIYSVQPKLVFTIKTEIEFRFLIPFTFFRDFFGDFQVFNRFRLRHILGPQNMKKEFITNLQFRGDYNFLNQEVNKEKIIKSFVLFLHVTTTTINVTFP